MFQLIKLSHISEQKPLNSAAQKQSDILEVKMSKSFTLIIAPENALSVARL